MRGIDQIVATLQQRSLLGVHRGEINMPYAEECTLDVGLTDDKGARFMFMRHVEDGRRFFALSLSFRLYKTGQPQPFEHFFARNAVPVFFGRHIVKTLVMPPQTAEGKRMDVWHFRLFTDPRWRPLDYTPLVTIGDSTIAWQDYATKVYQ